MTHEKMTIVVGARPERLSRFIVAVSEQHLADVRFGPHYGLKAAVAAGPKSAQQATSRGGKHSYPLWSTSTGKLSALIWPFTSVQKQST